MNIAEYYQSKFYPDLDISVIQEKLSVPDVFSKAVSLVHQTHYPDLPIETVAQSIEQPIRPPKVNYDLNVSDLRGKDTLTGKNIGTGLTTKTTSDLVKSIVKEAKAAGIDPYTALAMSLQETGLGNGWQDNPFHLSNSKSDNIIQESMLFLKDKMDYGKKLGKKTEAELIQAWNGYGKITPKSEYGGNMYYGIDVSKTPINMNKTPVYGDRIIDIRENVIKKNPQIMKIVDDFSKNNAFSTPTIKDLSNIK